MQITDIIIAPWRYSSPEFAAKIKLWEPLRNLSVDFLETKNNLHEFR